MISACQILNILIALGLACAITAALRGRGIGRWCPPPADPYVRPFGDMPAPEQLRAMHEASRTALFKQGFTPEQLEEIARRPVEQHHPFTPAATANPAGQGGGGVFRLPHAAAAVSFQPEDHFEWRRPRAF